jgi:hypothetical protein
MVSRHYRLVGFTATRLYTARYGFAYTGVPCFYCGAHATTRDHAFPLILLKELLDAEEVVHQERLVIVPACAECNGLLHSKVFPALTERKQYLKEALRKRYRKCLAMPPWLPEEIEALGTTLRSSVVQNLALQRLIQERLAW